MTVNEEQIKVAYLQGQLDYLDAIEALQRECGFSTGEAENAVNSWDGDEFERAE